jgi:hypothetical protein
MMTEKIYIGIDGKRIEAKGEQLELHFKSPSRRKQEQAAFA